MTPTPIVHIISRWSAPVPWSDELTAKASVQVAHDAYTALLGRNAPVDWSIPLIDEDKIIDILIVETGFSVLLDKMWGTTYQRVTNGEMAFVVCRNPRAFRLFGTWSFSECSAFPESLDFVRQYSAEHEALGWLILQTKEHGFRARNTQKLPVSLETALRYELSFDEYVKYTSFGITDGAVMRMMRMMRDEGIDDDLLSSL